MAQVQRQKLSPCTVVGLSGIVDKDACLCSYVIKAESELCQFE